MNVKSFHIFSMVFVLSVHVYLVVRVNAYLKISSVGDLSKKILALVLEKQSVVIRKSLLWASLVQKLKIVSLN